MPREWNNPIREPWNPIIHQLLKAIDNHNKKYFETGNHWHLQKANELRKYVSELKNWIYREERK